MAGRFTFIDLFAGIGGMRLAAEASGGRCLLSSEIDVAARRTYAANFGETPLGDVRAIRSDSVPSCDLLLAGFPCQPFSICAQGRGFEDTRGTLFFEVARLVEACRPRAVLLENVKFLKVHDGGRTLARILDVLRQDLGYHAEWRILDAKGFGLPQSRERIVIVATRDGPFRFPEWDMTETSCVADVLGPDERAHYLDPAEYALLDPAVVKRTRRSGLVFCGYRKRALRKSGVLPGTEHLSRAHKQPNRIYRSDGTHPTLAAGEMSGRYWILHEGRVRKISIEECFRLQGFPESFAKPCAAGQLYRQIGNSVPVPMIAAVIRELALKGHFGSIVAAEAA